MPELALTDALATQFFEVAQRQMQDAALAAIHRIELKGDLRLQDLLRDGQRTHPQFFNPQQPMIVGIEAQARMLVAWDAQDFHGQMLEGEHDFRLVRYQSIDVLAGEANNQIGSFEGMVRALAISDIKRDIQSGKRQDSVEESFDFRTGLSDGIFDIAHGVSARTTSASSRS